MKYPHFSNKDGHFIIEHSAGGPKDSCVISILTNIQIEAKN